MIDDDTSPPQTDTLWARLSLSIDGLTDTVRAERERRMRERPARGSRQRAGTVPATGPLILRLGTPAMGHRWNVRNISVTNASAVRTPAAGTADVYVGNPSAYGPDAYRWNIGAMPGTAGFSADRLVVIPTDHLFVVVEGGTPGDVLLARAEVLDYPAETGGRPVMPL